MEIQPAFFTLSGMLMQLCHNFLKDLLLIGTLLCLCSVAYAQEVSITVLSKQDLKEVAGVAIMVDGKYQASTDEYGNATLHLAENSAILSLKHLAFTPLADTIYANQHAYQFYLIPNDRMLADVEVAAPKALVLQEKLVLKEELESNLQSTLAQTISHIPGVNIISMGTGVSKPVIRGLFNNRVLVMENGLKKEMQQWGSDHGLMVDPQIVDELSIIKGAHVLKYGADGIGGVIDLKTLQMPEQPFEGSVSTSYKSVNQEVSSAASIKWKKQRVFGQVSLSGMSFADYRVPSTSFQYNEYVLPIYGQRLKNTAGDRYNLQASVGLRLDKMQWQVSLGNYQETVGIFIGAHGVPREEQLVDDGDYRNTEMPLQENTHRQLSAHGILTVSENTTWELDAGWQRNIRLEKGLPHHNNIDLSVADPFLENGLQLDTYAFNTRLVHEREKLELVVGLSGSHKDHQRDGYEFLIPDYRKNDGGLYLYGDYHITESWKVNAGLRYDVAFLKYDAFEMPQRDDEGTITGYQRRAEDYRSYFHNLSWVVGTQRKWDHMVTEVTLGKIFRTPEINEVGINGIHHGTFRHEWGNRNLSPESGYQLDLAWQLTKRGFSFSASPFLNYFTNFIYLKPSGSFLAPGVTKPLPGAGQVYTYVESETLHTGFEVSLRQQLTQNWALLQTGEYVWHQNLQTKTPIPFTPPFSATLELEYIKSIASDWLKKVKGNLRYRWTAAQERVDRNEYTTEGYHLLDLNTEATMRMGGIPLQLRFAVNNMLDTEYMNHLSRYRILNLPEPGRNYTVSLKIGLNKQA
ncbi:TonB-dependent receptor [Limibacter armeniacum]|uniref:TonB-dependent receptor n=1 Tax=Limibacter armeniacum TaxID=466084 RepID=UPI002FE59C07